MCIFVVYFVLQLCFQLPDEGNHQTHTFNVFNHTAHKIVNDVVSYVHIQTNNTYYNKDVLGLEMNKDVLKHRKQN
jgi:hypothetical protein